MSLLHRCLLCFVLLGSNAWLAASRADDLPRPTPIDQRYSVLGIRLGQTPAEVIPVVTAAFPPPARIRVFKDKTAGGAEFTTRVAAVLCTPATGTASGCDKTDELTVAFTAPASGNQSVSILRRIEYLGATDRPSVTATVSALEQKYGVPPRNTLDPPRITGRYSFDAQGQLRAESPLYGHFWCGLGLVDTQYGDRCRSALLDWQVEPHGTADAVDRVSTLLMDVDLRLKADAAEGVSHPSPAPPKL